MSELNLKTIRKIDNKEYLISTVHLCIEHPGNMWYETMIFPARDEEVADWGELYGMRYHTIKEAEEGHKTLVEMSDEYFLKELRS